MMVNTKRLFYSKLLYVGLVLSALAIMSVLRRPLSKVNYNWKKFNTDDIARWRDLLNVNNVWSVEDEKKSSAMDLASLHFDSDPNIPNVDCEKIFAGDEGEIQRVNELNLELTRSKEYENVRGKIIMSDQQVLELARNCSGFKKSRKYILEAMSPEENSYPIAYIITIHRDLMSFERLLRSIYHPQNVYCVHPDLKSDETFHAGVQAISDCFDNVFIASNLSSIQYTHISRVEADLNCMKDLVAWPQKRSRWRFVINLCGQDFPMKSNLELVRYLKTLGGYNNLESFHTPSHKRKRFEYHFDFPNTPGDYTVMEKTNLAKVPPPGATEMFAGSAYYVFKRQAVEYILTDPLVQDLIEWSRDTYSPDEFLWATIQRLYPQLPGSLPPHEKYDKNELVTLTRLVKWAGLDRNVYPKCGGAYRRGICVYGCSDLSWLRTNNHLFANKFYSTIDMFAVHCMDEWVRNKTIRQSWIYDRLGYI